MGKRLAQTVSVLVILLAVSGLAEASSGWHVVKRASATGQFATTATSATVNHPKALAIKLIGNVQSGIGVVACSKGYSVSSNSRSFSHAGLHSLPMTRHADSCDVTASVGGSGKVTVQILKK